MKRFPIPVKQRYMDYDDAYEKEKTLTIPFSKLDDEEISVIMSAVILERNNYFESISYDIARVYELITIDWPAVFNDRYDGTPYFVELTYLIEYWEYMLTIPLTKDEFIIPKRKTLIQGVME
jgi:hypothetical protein